MTTNDKTIHEQVAEQTAAMEAAIYAALGAIDGYSETVQRLMDEQLAGVEPNEMLVKRFRQLLGRAESMTTSLEDDVVGNLLFCVDRLFAVGLAEKGEFI